MGKNNFNGFLIKYTASILVAILLLIFSGITTSLHGQPVLGAQNISLGNGGTAYLSGSEALFWNPANLSINDRQGTIHVNIGQTGILYEPVLSSDIAGDQFFNFTDSYFPYRPGTTDITSANRKTILNENYPRNRLVSQHQTRADIMLGGLSWYRGEETFSIAARARFSSRIEVGKGWYSSNYVSQNNQEILDYTLDQHINQNLEIALGYAREFTFINGLFSRLNKLYVGISPTFIIAGPSFNARYNGQQIRSNDGTAEPYITDFSYHSSGSFTNMAYDYIASNNPLEAINNNLNKKLQFQPTGYGAAFNFGLTYLIPIGNSLNLIEPTPEESVVGKSLRISISVNDIGMIRYSRDPLTFSSPSDTLQTGQEFPQSSMFIGSGGQYLTYFDSATEIRNPLLNAQNPSDEAFSALTPSSLNGGILLDLKRLKFMGDLTIGLNNNAFTNAKLAMHIGIEARPVKKIPLRIGTRLATGLPAYVGLGTGFETRYLDFNIGSQIIFRSQTFTTEFVGGAFAGIQLHL